MQAIKYRIYPTRKQERKLNRYIHASRYAYNALIDYQDFRLAAAKAEFLDWSQAFVSEFDGYSLDPFIRKQIHWINRSVPVEIVRDGLSRAAAAFVGRWKHGRKYPKHKKYASNSSFSYGNNVKLFTKGSWAYLKVPGRMDIKVELHKELPIGKIKRITISKDVDQWFASVTYETESTPVYTPTSALALDEGLTSVLSLSTGDKIAPPKPLKAAAKRVKRLQRQLSRSQKGSNRRNRKRLRLARAHRKVRRIREYFGKYLAHRVTNLAQTNRSAIVWQDINVQGMMKNHRMANTFADVGISQIKIWIAQQAEKKGIPICTIPRFEKTSGVCPLCSTKHKLNLKDRTFICCGIKYDRDIASAQHMQQLWLETNQTLVGSTRAGRGVSFMGCQPSGLGSDHRLGLRPLFPRDGNKLSDEPSMEPPKLYRLPDADLSAVGQDGINSN